MEATEFNQNLKIRLVDKYDNMPDTIKKVFVTATDLEKQSDILVGTFIKSGVPEMLCLSDASAKAIGLSTNTQSFLKNINTGSKLARTAGTAGRVASKASSIAGAVGIGLEVVLQLKGDYDEMLQIEAKKNNRQNIRSEFNSAANALEDYSADYIKSCVSSPMEKSIRSIEDNISDLRSTREGRSEKCIRLENIQREIQALIARIHEAEA